MVGAGQTIVISPTVAIPPSIMMPQQQIMPTTRYMSPAISIAQRQYASLLLRYTYMQQLIARSSSQSVSAMWRPQETTGRLSMSDENQVSETLLFSPLGGTENNGGGIIGGIGGAGGSNGGDRDDDSSDGTGLALIANVSSKADGNVDDQNPNMFISEAEFNPLSSEAANQIVMTKSPMRAFIFDNDGIVINSEPIIFEATARVFSSYGIRLHPEDVQGGIGAGSKYVQYPKEKYGLVNVTVEELMAAREKEFRKLAYGRLHPFPGFFTLMKLLKEKGILTALASSASTDVVYHNLSLANIDFRLFDNVVDSAKIENKKPFPDIFLAAAKNLCVPPSNCLVIEDAPPGIEAAHRAGMRVVAISTSLPKSFLNHSDYIIDSIEDIIGMLDKLVRGTSHENK